MTDHKPATSAWLERTMTGTEAASLFLALGSCAVWTVLLATSDQGLSGCFPMALCLGLAASLSPLAALRPRVGPSAFGRMVRVLLPPLMAVAPPLLLTGLARDWWSGRQYVSLALIHMAALVLLLPSCLMSCSGRHWLGRGHAWSLACSLLAGSALIAEATKSV